ncbi:MAG: aminotransferase class I/II-fold pyridoxal phosphate-dependent enzyme [Gemmatimonadaceae bacterium]|nr:aminotransferase class I/II-fold pyridoxal phosphate-dependent enzyme [Gemmatimonadaceae bacterium]
MRRAMADAEVGDDVLDGDPTTRRLEAVVAERLGKEAALFFPTGTMANQAAIAVHCAPGTEIFVDAESHIVHWEMAGAAALAGVQIRPVISSGPTMRADDLVRSIRFPSSQAPESSLVCVENTHNGAGGMISSLDALREIHTTASAHQLAVHMDGARLWNASAATGTPLADFAACAESVMVSFSKGLGAPVGAALAGTRTFIERARRARKRFGGGMRQSGILAAAALHGLEHHLARLPEDHEAARYLGLNVDGINGAVVVPPDTNILMIDLPSPTAAQVVERAREEGLLISAWNATRLRAVTHLDAQAGLVAQAAIMLAKALDTK